MRALLITMTMSILSSTSSVYAADDYVSWLAISTTQAAEAPENMDSAAMMRELCESYADDENIAATERPAHIEACLASMTTDLADMEVTNVHVSTSEPLSSESNQDPEAMIADELVDAPAPGVEQLETDSTP